jgi:hypothetical protein
MTVKRIVVECACGCRAVTPYETFCLLEVEDLPDGKLRLRWKFPWNWVNRVIMLTAKFHRGTVLVGLKMADDSYRLIPRLQMERECGSKDSFIAKPLLVDQAEAMTQ